MLCLKWVWPSWNHAHVLFERSHKLHSIEEILTISPAATPGSNNNKRFIFLVFESLSTGLMIWCLSSSLSHRLLHLRALWNGTMHCV